MSTPAAPISAPTLTPPTPPTPDTAPPSRDPRAQAWLNGFVPRLRGALRQAVALGTASGVLVVAQAGVLARLIASAVEQRALPRHAPAWLLALLLLYLLRFALVRGSERVAFRAGAALRQQLRGELLAHVQRLGPLWLRGRQRGDLVNSLVNGIEALEAYFARYLPTARVTALVPAAILLAVFPVDWISGLVLLFTAPLIPLFMWLIGRGAEDMNQQQWLRLARLSARFLDTLQGLTTLRLLGASRREALVVQQVSEEYRAATMRVLRVAFLSSVVLEFLSTVSIAMVAVLIGFRLMWGQMHFLQGFFVLLLAPEYYAPLRALGGVYHLRMDAIGAAQRLQPVFELQPPAQAGGHARPPATPPALRFDDLHFAYEPGREALRGCAFEAPAGRVTALVGASGAGKSTVLALLLGLARAQRGRIEVDGVALESFDTREWLRGVALVPQRAHVFAASIADNLRLARPDADLQALRRAARAAGAEAFIDALPEGFDTLLGERGAGLSGGQVQRLALARALLRDAPLLLLDEPTASLDADAQQEVLDALRAAVRGRTVLMVSHRLRTLELADHVVVLEAGRVAEQGSPAQLAAAGGALARLLRTQRGEPA
ncbi:MAG: thiol reductant ABC exporter subunit CydD [Betaproteobacteria bacterium]|nr:thiol reductant ABC exporter subunit CydD [Betaproteobacteria bacterium]MBU6513672.1 thiol reductant ABC exporter subunit CydD [Betaproteobacteria bacterium]MDE2151008.1 thiol reductant ABC exporter subunit CydD [Betaproteobacteria bacterium]